MIAKAREELRTFNSEGEVHYPVIRPEHRICDRCERGSAEFHMSPQPTPIATVEDLAAWQDFISRWTIDYPVRARWEAFADEGHHVRIRRVMRSVPDSSDPTRILAIDIDGLLVPSSRPDGESARWVRAALVYHLIHELDEFLTFDGDRVFDPHNRRPTLCEACITADDRHERKEYQVTPIDHRQLREMDRDDFRFYREHGPFETMEELRAARVGSR
jgi:hypothetical protein